MQKAWRVAVTLVCSAFLVSACSMSGSEEATFDGASFEEQYALIKGNIEGLPILEVDASVQGFEGSKYEILKVIVRDGDSEIKWEADPRIQEDSDAPEATGEPLAYAISVGPGMSDDAFDFVKIRADLDKIEEKGSFEGKDCVYNRGLNYTSLPSGKPMIEAYCGFMKGVGNIPEYGVLGDMPMAGIDFSAFGRTQADYENMIQAIGEIYPDKQILSLYHGDSFTSDGTSTTVVGPDIRPSEDVPCYPQTEGSYDSTLPTILCVDTFIFDLDGDKLQSFSVDEISAENMAAGWDLAATEFQVSPDDMESVTIFDAGEGYFIASYSWSDGHGSIPMPKRSK